MSFYLRPPRGLINLHTFQDCIEQRLKCYDYISSNETELSNFVCLVEDSPLDRTGHYLFRLWAFFNTSFRQVFLANEQKLLLLRLNCYGKNDVKYFLKRLLKHSKECLAENSLHGSVEEIYFFFISMSSFMLRQDYLNHIFKQDHINSECEKFNLRVPFHLCASLIVRREVNLNKGFVEIECSKWKTLFMSLYETYLRNGITEMKYSQNVHLAANDVRIKNIFKIINNHLFKNELDIVNGIGIQFDISSIGFESKFFPLCMLNLYKVLEKTNRLPHNERFDFSLYMKDIGISLSDSLKFWENAYTKQHSDCSKCSHDWKSNEKRYIYGIRHLYGLEGSRKNYGVRSCNYFQEKTLSPIEDGGCPFKHFDDKNLRQVLKKLLSDKEDEIEVMVYERKNHPSKSCKLFYEIIFKSATNSNTLSNINFSNPAEYYLSLKQHIKNAEDALN